MVGRWLLKTEPEEWSWEHQQASGGVSHWDGVRNALAQKHLRSMEQGDLCLFYHSGAKAKEIVGIARVCKPFYPDPSDASCKHGMVDIEAVSKLSQPLSLSRLKQADGLHSFLMFRQPRLSVVPVSSSEWSVICELAGQLEPPLLLDNGDFRINVSGQALESSNGEAKGRGREESKPSLHHHNANVRDRDIDETAQCDEEAGDVLPNTDAPKAKRRPRKPKSDTDAIKIKASGPIPHAEALQPSYIRHCVVEPIVIAHNNTHTAESASAVDLKEDDGTFAPLSESITKKSVKLVPDPKRVYSRRSRKQGKMESLHTNAEINDSRGMAFADAGRVYKRRNR